jgi:hypothetical protein
LTVATDGQPYVRVAAGALTLATRLLLEAAGTAEAAGWKEATNFEAAARELQLRVDSIELEQGGDRDRLAEAARVALELAQLAVTLADGDRASRVDALACAALAESGARVAVEALTETFDWSQPELVSRRARQLVDVTSARRRLGLLVDVIEGDPRAAIADRRALVRP